MSTVVCNDVHWDGQSLILQWSLQKEADHSGMQLIIKNRKTNKIRLLKQSTEQAKLGWSSLELHSLDSLTSGKWDLYCKYGRTLRRIRLNGQAKVELQTRYFTPINYIGVDLAYTLFLTDDYYLSLHCAKTDSLEANVYNIVTYHFAIEEIVETNDEVKLQVPLPHHWTVDSSLVITDEYNVRSEVSAYFYDNQLTINKEQFSSYHGQWSFSLQRKDGRIVERALLYIDEKETQWWGEERLRTTRYEYVSINEKSSLKLPIKEKSRPEHVIKGELIAKNLLMSERYLMFEIPQSPEKVEWRFFLQRKNGEEKLYLHANNTFEKDTLKVSLAFEHMKFAASKGTMWTLYAEKLHDSYVEERRVGQFQTGLPKSTDRYVGFFEIDEELGAVPVIQKSLVYTISFMSKQQYYKLKAPLDISIHSFKMKNGVITLTMSMHLLNQDTFQFDGMKLIDRKDTSKVIELPVKQVKETKQGKLIITSEVDLNQLNLEPFYWDFYASITMKNHGQRDIRVYSDHYFVIKKLRHLMFKYTLENKEGYITYPYLTVNGGLSITHRKKGEFEEKKHKWTEYAAYIYYHLFFQFFNRKPVWLVHEKFSETAQDNSFYFFRYCYLHQAERNVYYVIKKGTIDEKNLEPYKDRVVYFMSFKHLVRLLSAKLIISSEAKGHGYAWRVSQGVIRKFVTEKKYIFLQHGVLGLKKVDSTFDYNTQNSAELFVSSSDFEKRIITNYFGYSDDQVIVTGLPRWDVLEDKSDQVTGKREILLMPTWRNWLEEVEESEFIQSDYYQAYNTLLQSKELHDVLKEHHLLLNFYVHPKFMPYVSTFTESTEHVRVLQFGDEKVNELIMRAHLLITDYSSVSWEMYYQKKPVIFFQFDVDQYNQYQGSYMDLNKDLFGKAVYDPSSLIQTIATSAQLGFKENEEYARKRNEYFKYVDKNNSKRIYEEIEHKEKEIDKRKKITDMFRHSDIVKVLWRRYRYTRLVQFFEKRLLKRFIK